MEYQVFQELLEKNSGRNFFIFLIIVLIYIFIYKKRIISIFDPLLLYIIPSLAASSFMIILLVFNGLISENTFYNLFLYQILFVIGSKVVKKNNIKEKIKNDINLFKIFYMIHTTMFLFVIIIFFRKFGISLIFNKFLIFNSGAFLNYATICLFPGQTILVFIKRNLFYKKNKADYILLFLSVGAFLVKGGKGDFINCISYMLITVILINKYNKSEAIKNKIKKIQLLLLLVSFSIIMFFFSIVTQAKTYQEILYQIYLRLLNYGDIYYTGFVNNIIERVPKSYFYEYYFWAFISPLRDIFNFRTPVIIGNLILQEIYKYPFEMGGPNFRFDVAINYYFPLLFGIILALALGMLYSYLRKISIFNNFLDIYLQSYFIFSSILITIDFGLFTTSIVALLVYIPIILCISLVVKKVLEANKNNRKRIG